MGENSRRYPHPEPITLSPSPIGGDIDTSVLVSHRPLIAATYPETLPRDTTETLGPLSALDYMSSPTGGNLLWPTASGTNGHGQAQESPRR